MIESKSTLQINQPVKPVPSQVMKALPNLFTLAALASGLSAIMYVIDGAYASAIGCLILAMLLDACDGRVARYAGTSSKFGAELDSLSDVVCFGAAPALLLYEWGLAQYPFAGWFVCVVLASATALRLARFNIAISAPDKPAWSSAFFQGVPSPAGAFLSLFPFYLSQAQILDADVSKLFALLWVPLVAGLMVSDLPTFSGKLISRVLSRAWFIFLGSSLVLAYSFWAHGVWNGLVVATIGYVALFPLAFQRYKHLLSRD
jgi:CDP-diacylglycerol---serine O-phosphatidyltransferase